MRRRFACVVALVVGMGLGVGSAFSAGAAEKQAPGAQKPAAAAEKAGSQAAKAPIDINTATVDELKGLPEIGETKAKAIVDYRTKNGKFKTVDDLKNVKGIGDKTLAKIKPLIVAK